MLKFEPFEGDLTEWDRALADFSDQEIFQTSAWLRFLADSQRGKPVVSENVTVALHWGTPARTSWRVRRRDRGRRREGESIIAPSKTDNTAMAFLTISKSRT